MERRRIHAVNENERLLALARWNYGFDLETKAHCSLLLPDPSGAATLLRGFSGWFVRQDP